MVVKSTSFRNTLVAEFLRPAKILLAKNMPVKVNNTINRKLNKNMILVIFIAV